MKITVKRSRWPWGRPSVVIEIKKNAKDIGVSGAKWSIISDWHSIARQHGGGQSATAFLRPKTHKNKI